MSKLSKLFKSPCLYFRDYLVNRYPINFGSYNITNYEIFSRQLHKQNLALQKTGFDIDVVFTWVDNKDEKWQKKFLPLKTEYTKSYSKIIFKDSLTNNRFSNHDEIRYSVACIQKNLPWVKNIYIITDNQIPILSNYDKVTIINHSEIIPEQFLPTFNSHVIECFLWKIENLSEFFIYFNDDVFVCKPQEKEHFFRSNGLTSLFLAKRSLTMQKKKGKITATLSASLNSIKLLNNYFGDLLIDKPLLHTYIPLRKSSFASCTKLFEDDIIRFSKYKFRSIYDLNFATFLVPYYMYFTGTSFENVDLCMYTDLSNNSFNKIFNFFLQSKISDFPDSLCINDVNNPNKINLENYKILMSRILSNDDNINLNF